MKKSLKFFLFMVMLSLVMVPLFSGGTQEAAQDAGAEDAGFPEMEVSFASSGGTPEQWAYGMERLSDYVSNATDGKVTVRNHFNASLYTQDQELPAIMSGDLGMTLLLDSMLADYMPELSMLSGAYMFKNYDHMRAFYASDAAEQMFDKIADKVGVRIIGVSYYGARSVNLAVDKKITSRADLANIKIRMINNNAYLFMGEALGANPIPIAFSDLYLALQAGTVDGQDNPPATALANSFDEVTSSYTLTGHVVGAHWLAINEDLWQSMDPKVKQVFTDAVAEYVEFVDGENLRLDTEAVDEIRGKGITVYELTDEELTAYSQEVKDYYLADDDIRKDWDMDLYNQIQNLAK